MSALSWFKGSWMGNNSGDGLRDFEDERRRKALDVVSLGGLTPEQIVEANRLQSEYGSDLGNMPKAVNPRLTKPPAQAQQGGSFDPNWGGVPYKQDPTAHQPLGESSFNPHEFENRDQMPADGADLMSSYKSFQDRIAQPQAPRQQRDNSADGIGLRGRTMGYLDGAQFAGYTGATRENPTPDSLADGFNVGQRFDQSGQMITQPVAAPVDITQNQRGLVARFNQLLGAGDIKKEIQKTDLQLKQEQVKKMQDGGNTGKLTPEAIKGAGEVYYRTGTLPALGMGGANDKKAIMNAAAEYAQSVGDDNRGMALRWTSYAADAGAYKRNTQFATQVGQYEVKAKKEFALAKTLADKVNAKGNTAFNQWKREVLDGKVAGDPDFKNLQATTLTALTEYGKIVSGGALSAQALTDSAQKEMQKILSASESLTAFKNRIDTVILPSMKFQTEAINETQSGLEQRLGARSAGAGFNTNMGHNDPLGIR